MRLRLADTPELAESPCEFLYDPRRASFRLNCAASVTHRTADE